MDLVLALLLQFQVSRGFELKPTPFAVAAAPAFDVRPGPPPVPQDGYTPPGDLVTVARDRAAREGRVLVVWVGNKDNALAASLPPRWLQVGPVPSYGGEQGPGAAVGVPDNNGKLFYRGLVPATRRAMDAEVRDLSPTARNAPAPPPVWLQSLPAPRGGNC